MGLDLPLALAEVYRRQGYIEEALRWFLQTIEWSWNYNGHWTSEVAYADQAYKRLVEVLMSLPKSERRRHFTNIEEWFQQNQSSIPVMSKGLEEQRFIQWLQAVDVGP